MTTDDLLPPQSVESLEDCLSQPTSDLIESLATLEGDLVLLGVGGKMGPTMARMAVRAWREAGKSNRVLGVSRFSNAATRERLESWGVETIACDLLDAESVSQLPDAAYAISMSGFKFGAREHPELAWATNCYLPSLVCSKYRDSRIVAFSTGNVYELTSPASGGSVETDAPAPIGEYAHTALGRERMFEYFSRRNNTPVLMLRLNYATELRYGVLVDLAHQLKQGDPISVAMGHVNVIWLHDANVMSLRALTAVADRATEGPAPATEGAAPATGPFQVLNLAGSEILNIREVCEQLATLMGVKPNLVGEEAPLALLNNGHAAYATLGRPAVDAETMIRWTADWVGRGGELLGKPTHFEVRDGKF